MKVSATALRADIYKLLDRVATTGEALEVDRNGVRLEICRVEPDQKLDRLVRRPEALRCDPEEIVSIDWSEEWTPFI